MKDRLRISPALSESTPGSGPKWDSSRGGWYPATEATGTEPSACPPGCRSRHTHQTGGQK
ncbi:hypothetical protein ACFVUW_30035 [Streptomyces xiamenensis]|uniref:hypothetical protein n=1 Tax=Streptomyces xiamenensis TaxID=408015 RepID=UPI0036F18F69